jgi:hypothetical protein
VLPRERVQGDPDALRRLREAVRDGRGSGASDEEVRQAEADLALWEPSDAVVNSGFDDILRGFSAGAAFTARMMDVRSASGASKAFRTMGDADLNALTSLETAVRFEVVGMLLRLLYARMAWNHRPGLPPLDEFAPVTGCDLGLRRVRPRRPEAGAWLRLPLARRRATRGRRTAADST